MHISVITLFPEMFSSLKVSILGRALKENLWRLDLIELREFGVGKHKSVDRSCYGGGAGMLLRADVVHEAVLYAHSLDVHTPQLVYLSPRGATMRQTDIEGYVSCPYLIILCGRYEGVDERVLEFWNFQQKCIGNFVVSGGELPAMMFIDGCVRCLPGVLGNSESLVYESFQNNALEHPQYTYPELWMGRKVPEVLRSGHHQKIKAWKEENSLPENSSVD
ncbi:MULTISPECIES: tRNA (guanosine(37)-N1)-methyltransferase TrmD [Holospora]|uniref:tRNA (guanine-N(1)-)-methyltransferase n=2 Tax=Holospora TaxID=44747 RepID=A0A061JFW6_9PROT|nr:MULTISPECIES: tRNA (guanosine(37)-N1)-methyltransferase TrmD [Holospora]ETZ04656.1 tRNA (guanine-N(1)-)-methyltransferase [Holospora undulata HU1]GAJ46068.1 tRNA (guanine-N(1)-)-methyltransferase [Holospora elegans E1]